MSSMSKALDNVKKNRFILLSLLFLIAMCCLQMNIISIKQKLNVTNMEYAKVKKRYSQLEMIQNNIIGKDINDLNLFSLSTAEKLKLSFTNGFIAFASLSGCGKCVGHHLEVVSKIEGSDIYYIIESEGIKELKILQSIYKLKNIYWDRLGSMSSIVAFDTKKNNPFLLVIKKGIVVGMKFSYLDDLNYANDIIPAN